jgi:hypothetical protein
LKNHYLTFPKTTLLYVSQNRDIECRDDPNSQVSTLAYILFPGKGIQVSIRVYRLFGRHAAAAPAEKNQDFSTKNERPQGNAF